jgi:predicted nucleic acid-binding protein
MISVDTNILIYAHRQDSPWHDQAVLKLKTLAENTTQFWAIPWPCIHEFLAIYTHLKIFNPPSSLKQSIEQVEEWLKSPSLQLIGEDDCYWDVLKKH